MNSQHRSGWAGPFAAALLCAASSGQAQVPEQTVTITARQDTSIYSGTPGSHLLADGSGDYLWLSVTAEGLVRRLLRRFDLSTLPAGAVVRQATLSLYESHACGLVAGRPDEPFGSFPAIRAL